MAQFIIEMNNKAGCNEQEWSFAQQHLLHKGLKLFGENGIKATHKEVKQLHNRSCWKPISVADMTSLEQKRVQIALTYLTEKRDGIIKARTVFNGKPT